MTVSNRSGAAHDGARSQGKAPEGAPGGQAHGPVLGARGAEGTSGAEGTGAVHGAPVTWPGQAPDEVAADEAATAEVTPAGGTAAGGTAAEAAEAEAAEAEASGPEPMADEAESADLPLWDWSPPAERSAREPSGAAPRAAEPRAAEPRAAEPRAAEPRAAEPPGAERAEPAKPEWKPVVTPVEEAGGEPRPGIGERRGNLAHLSANPRMRIWQLRAVSAVVILAAFWALVSWKLGLTLAVIAIIADTIYRARKGYSGKVKLTAAQRRTRRQLTKLGRAGYRAMHARPIPESQDQIDHLVVGPAGVFAIDSEDWDKRLAVRTKKGTQLWHGPFSQKDRLQHAQWEAQRAAEMLSDAIGKPVSVRAAMAVYGPRIPWDVATIREVDVFSGPRLRKYLRRRARQGEVRPLTDEEIERIFAAANQAFPHLSSGSRAR